MAKKQSGCGGVIVMIGIGAAVGAAVNGAGGAVIGAAVGGLLAYFLFRSPAKPSGTCDICGSPVIRISYKAVVNGRKFGNVCAKCKNQLTAKVRKEKLKELLNP
jgi:hypothetical protein